LLREQHKKLDEYEKELFGKYAKMMNEQKQQLQQDSLSALETARLQLQSELNAEIDKKEQLLRQHLENEAKITATVQLLEHKLATMVEEHHELILEIERKNLELMEYKAVNEKRYQEAHESHTTQLQQSKHQLSKQISDRENQIFELQNQLVAQERDSKLTQEKLKLEIEQRVTIKYEKIQKEFEESLLSEAQSAQDMIDELLKEREDQLQRQEKELLNKLFKLRKQQELELANKRVELQRELTEKHQELISELQDRDSKRELDKSQFKLECEQKYQQLERDLELNFERRKQTYEKPMFEKYETLQTQILERDRQRQDDFDLQQQQLRMKYEELTREVTSKEKQLETQKNRFEMDLKQKYEKQHDEEEQSLLEQKQLLEKREQELLDRFQKMVEQHRQQLEHDALDRNKRTRELLEQQTEQELILATKREESEREFLKKQQMLQEQLLEREKERHYEKEKFKLELSSQYEEKLRELKKYELDMEREKEDYVAVLRAKYEEFIKSDQDNVAQQRAKLQEYEKTLYSKFQSLIEEHKMKVDTEMKKKYDSLRETLEVQVNEQLYRTQQSEQQMDSYQIQVETVINQLKLELSGLEEKYKDRTSEIVRLKGENMELLSESKRIKEDARIEVIQEINALKTKFSEELTDRDRSIAELRSSLATKDQETQLIKEKHKREIEMDLKVLYEQKQRTLELKLKQEQENIIKQFEESTKQREESVYKLEIELTEKLDKQREQHDLEITAKSLKLEKGLLERYQKLKEELLEREQQREREKEEYRREFEKDLEQHEKSFREKEIQLEQQKLAFETQLQKDYNKMLQEEQDKVNSQKNHLEDLEKGLLQKYEKLIEEHKQQLAKDEASRNLMKKSLIEDQDMFIAIEKKKQEMENELLAKYNNLKEDLYAIDKQREAEVRKQKKSLDEKCDKQLEQLKQQEAAMEQEKINFLNHIKTKYEDLQQGDFTQMKHNKRKLEEYEIMLQSRFKSVLEELEVKNETEFKKRQDMITAQLENQLTREIAKREELKSHFEAYKQQVEATLVQLREQYDELQQKYSLKTSEAMTLKSQNIQLISEMEKSKDEVRIEFQMQISSLKSAQNEAITEKERVIIHLKEQMTANDRELQSWRERTKTEIELQLKDSYNQNQKDFEHRLIEDLNASKRHQHDKDLKERMEFENNLRSYYEEQLLQSETVLRNQFNKLLADQEENFRKQRQSIEDQRKRELESLMTQRQRLEQETDGSRKQFEKDLRDKYESILASYKKQIEELIASREQVNLNAWQNSEQDLTARLNIEEEVRRKYEVLLSQQKLEFEGLKQDLQQYYNTEIEKREKKLRDITLQQQDQRIQYENEMREKYMKLIDEYQETHRKDQQQQLNKDLDDLQRKADIEKDKTVMMKDLEARLEKDYKEKYQAIIDQLQQNWLDEIKHRELKIEQRIKEHYDALLTTKQEQLDLALDMTSNVNHAEKEQWAMAIQELKSKHARVIDLLEEKIKAKYENRLAEYEQVYKSQLSYFETHQQYGTSVETESQIQRKLTKYKIAFAKWKFDYQNQVKEKYDKQLTELQSSYLRQLDQRPKSKLPETTQELAVRDLESSLSKIRGSEKTAKLHGLQNQVKLQWEKLGTKEISLLLMHDRCG
jgi:hypothetical protein